MNAFTQRLIPVEVEEVVRIPSTVPGGNARTIMVKVPALKDPKDGEIYLGPEADAILDKAKARHMGVLAPQELVELRRRLDLTQSEIADLLQIGEKSWSRWETGREVPSRSINLLLIALYEGKISLPWLREQGIADGKPLPAPVLRARGWELLFYTQFERAPIETTNSTQAEAIAMAVSHISRVAIYNQIASAVDEVVSGRQPSHASTFAAGARGAGNYERMPLCA